MEKRHSERKSEFEEENMMAKCARGDYRNAKRASTVATKGRGITNRCIKGQ